MDFIKFIKIISEIFSVSSSMSQGKNLCNELFIVLMLQAVGLTIDEL